MLVHKAVQHQCVVVLASEIQLAAGLRRHCYLSGSLCFCLLNIFVLKTSLQVVAKSQPFGFQTCLAHCPSPALLNELGSSQVYVAPSILEVPWVFCLSNLCCSIWDVPRCRSSSGRYLIRGFWLQLKPSLSLGNDKS